MLDSAGAEPSHHPAWITEPGFDGLRVLVRLDGDDLGLINRNATPQPRCEGLREDMSARPVRHQQSTASVTN